LQHETKSSNSLQSMQQPERTIMPTRMIRDGFLDSEKINALSPEAECFFVRLILCADDHGRFDGRELMLKSRMYPLKPKMTVNNINRLLTECIKMELLIKYESNNKPYLLIPEFNQRLRAKKSKFPDPPKNCLTSDGHLQAGKNKMLETETETETETEGEKNIYDQKFELFWEVYPKRKGKKVGKKASLKNFKKITLSNIDRVIKNAKNYGLNNAYPKDPERFLRNDFWKDWDTPMENNPFNSSSSFTQKVPIRGLQRD